MGKLICLHAKDEIESFTRRNPYLHLYEAGDLDDFFWPQTTWYGLIDNGEVRQIALLYADMSMPVVLVNALPPSESARALLTALLPQLPRRFYAHLPEGAAEVLARAYSVQSHGDFLKMGLLDRTRLTAIDASAAVALTTADDDELAALYAVSYPRNWFVPRMLATGFYFGVRQKSELVSVAGVHVVSRSYGVATIGNITTRPDCRGQGYGTLATARVCQELANAGIAHIGLNVKADNPSAIACYEKLGFQRVAAYGEYTVG